MYLHVYQHIGDVILPQYTVQIYAGPVICFPIMDPHRFVETTRFMPPMMQPYMQQAVPTQHMPYNRYPMMPIYQQPPPPPALQPYAYYNPSMPMPNTYFPQQAHQEYSQQTLTTPLYPTNYNNYYNPNSAYNESNSYNNYCNNYANTVSKEVNAIPVEKVNFSNSYESTSTMESCINNTLDTNDNSDYIGTPILEENLEEYFDDVSKCLNSSELSQIKLTELTNLALKGCSIVEKLSALHRNRPCFKKIDTLCARLKQDITRPNSVLPNINSQGIAWAVKDFIFVFTRMLSAWIIMKGYVYNNAKGLNHVKSAFSDEFLTSFLAWQQSTLAFTANLIKSIVSLNNLMHVRGNALQKQAEDENLSTITEADKMYLKTGTYTPVLLPDKTSNTQTNSLDSSSNSSVETNKDVPTASSTPMKVPPNWLDYGVRVLVNNVSEFSKDYDPRAPTEYLSRDFVDELNLLLERILNMQHAEYFFDKSFGSKYFPAFFEAYQREFRDLRMIIHRCQIGAYKQIYDVVYDIKLIPFLVFLFLRDNIDPKLHACATLFHKELSYILKQPPFDKYEFHYTGGGHCKW